MSLPVKLGLKTNHILRLAIFLLPAIFLFACQHTGENISSSTLNKDDELSVIFVDSFDIKCSTFYRDSINTSNPAFYLSGDFSNEAYGRVTCNSYFQAILLNNSSFVPGKDATYDSMILVLDPFYNYGAEDGIIRISIHRLKEDLNFDSLYYFFDEAEYDKTPIADTFFTVNDIKGDGLRIPLLDLGQEFFDKSKNDDFASTFFTSNDEFVKFFKGFAIVTEFAENAVVGFAPEDAQNLSRTGLYFYSHIESPDDTLFVIYKFPISTGSAGFNQIISERPAQLSSLKNEGQLIKSENSSNSSYVQAGHGVIAQLEIPSIDGLRYQFDNVIINRAEILIRSSDNNIPYYDPPSTLFLFKSDENQEIIPFGASSFGEIGSGIKIGNDFLFNITSYFQLLIQGTEQKSSYLLIPSVNGSSVNQLIFNDRVDPDKPIRLMVYYIPVNP